MPKLLPVFPYGKFIEGEVPTIYRRLPVSLTVALLGTPIAECSSLSYDPSLTQRLWSQRPLSSQGRTLATAPLPEAVY